MPINESKSIFLEYGMESIGSIVMDQLKAIFLYSFQELDQGFKYLSFQLKPSNYKKSNQFQLLKKIENKIDN